MRHPDDGTLMAMVDGEIPSQELAPLAAHLEECGDCRARLEAVRQLVAGTDQLMDDLAVGAPGSSPTVGMPAGARRSRTPLYRNLAWAATTVLAVGLGYWLRGPGMPGIQENLAVRQETPATEPVAPPPAAPVAAEPPAPAPGAQPATRPARRDTPAPPPGESTLAKVNALAEATERTEAAAGASRERPAAAPAPPAPVPFAVGRVAAQDMPRAAMAQMALADRSEVALESFAPISFVDAVARMGGTLRLVDGLVPDRLEASSRAVRVIYPLQVGELVLEQQRLGDSVVVALSGPISADSLAVLRRRVR